MIFLPVGKNCFSEAGYTRWRADAILPFGTVRAVRHRAGRLVPYEGERIMAESDCARQLRQFTEQLAELRRYL